MDKLQKTGVWFWNNKERMVLVVMVAVLAYRVYEVLNPPPPRSWTRLPAPMASLPEDPEERQSLGLPSNPPARPPLVPPGDYVSFYERNPFWYHSGQARQEGAGEVSAEELNIQLLDIQSVGGRNRARLRTIRTTAWYYENAQFEEFELQQINPDTQEVVVYSERHSRPFTLRKQ